jgi:hypothetical protein
MEPERETAGPALRAVLHHIAAPPRTEYAQPRPREALIPNEVVVGFGFDLLDKTFGDSWHVSVPQYECAVGSLCGSTTAAPGKKFQRIEGFVC